ncbi:MAG: hypothetical protein Q8Q06_02240 [bacterium]|nr:hypothetical protein [bacterium]
MKKQIFHLYFNDDFDGVSSAALFSYFVNKKWPGKYKFKYNLAVFKPGYQKEWIGKKLPEPSAVFDFRYHPDAGWWFDHHESSFIYESQKKNFKNTAQKAWDKNRKSCCSLILNHLSGYFNFEFPGYLKELAKEADIIDSAGYKSAKEALEPKESAIKLSNILPLGFSTKDAKAWIESLASGPMSEVMKLDLTKKRMLKAERIISKAIEEAKNFSKVIGDTVFLPGGRIFSRFAVYLVYPKAYYAVIVSDVGEYYHIGAGKNPWLEVRDQKDISEVMKKFGGGGHVNVGATEVKTKKEALQIAEKVVEILNSKAVKL